MPVTERQRRGQLTRWQQRARLQLPLYQVAVFASTFAMVLLMLVSMLPSSSLAFSFTSIAAQHKCSLITTTRSRILVDDAENQALFALQNDNSNDIVSSTVEGVTLKMAFDSSEVWGVADLSEFKSERFTSAGSLDLVHRLRRCSDCVLVGRGTVERDDCTLTVRRVPLEDGQTQPTRVILDPNQSLLKEEMNSDAKYSIFHDTLHTLLYHGVNDNAIDVSVLLGDGTNVESISLTNNEPSDDTTTTTTFQRYLSPTMVVDDLKKRGIHHIMVEGGPTTARAFLDEGTVDRAILIRAPFCFREPLESHITEASLETAGLEKLGSTICDGDTVEFWSKPGLSWPRSDFSQWP